MSGDLKVGVEIEKGQKDGLFTREGVCKAVKAVMFENSEVAKPVREIHGIQRELSMKQGIESSYNNGLV
ncbi:hypothetical protein Ddye_023846 [Dipteronia dyeriana]|uniref:Uncharacterized protein n=1 Tax=Dipteronia dyeriana TaxID=168575 RepID=A0AAD9TUQ9_9ROSI|nr:hypothetical protein Ddye_023846 [Dipteronia dyeriana]